MHRHVWKIVGRQALASLAENALSVGTPITGDGMWPHQVEAIFGKKHLITSRCEQCGTEKVERV